MVRCLKTTLDHLLRTVKGLLPGNRNSKVRLEITWSEITTKGRTCCEPEVQVKIVYSQAEFYLRAKLLDNQSGHREKTSRRVSEPSSPYHADAISFYSSLI
jgi:hypothetical protein